MIINSIMALGKKIFNKIRFKSDLIMFLLNVGLPRAFFRFLDFFREPKVLRKNQYHMFVDLIEIYQTIYKKWGVLRTSMGGAWGSFRVENTKSLFAEPKAFRRKLYRVLFWSSWSTLSYMKVILFIYHLYKKKHLGVCF